MQRTMNVTLVLLVLAVGASGQRVALSAERVGSGGAPRGGSEDGPGPTIPEECVDAIVDASGGPPLFASEAPLLGRLRVLSSTLTVDDGGWVGVASLAPQSRFFVGAGDLRVDDASLDVRASSGQRMELGLSTTLPGARLYDASTAFVADGVPQVQLLDGGLTLRATDAVLAAHVEVEQALGADRALVHAEGPAGAGLAIDADGQGHRFEAHDGLGSGRWWMGFDDVNDAMLLSGGDDDRAGVFELQDPAGTPELELRAVDHVSGDGGAVLRASSDEDVEVAALVAAEQGGSLVLRDDDGALRVRLDAQETANGALLRLWNSGGAETVRLLSEDPVFTDPELHLRAASARSGIIASNKVDFFRRPGASGAVLGATIARPGSGIEPEGLHLFNDGVSGHSILVGAVTSPSRPSGTLAVQHESFPGSLPSPFFVHDNQFALRDATGLTTISNDGVAGTKSAIVHTDSYGARHFYCSEGARAWFEDAGRARTRAGAVEIALDPVFLETVVVDEQHPYLVEVSARGANAGLWVEKHADRFVVHELPGGSGEVAFDWRVQARRTGLEDARLEPFTR